MKWFVNWLVWTVMVFGPAGWVHAEVYYLPGDCFYSSTVSLTEDMNFVDYDNAGKQISLRYQMDDDSEAGLGGYLGFDRAVISNGEALWTSIENVVQHEKKRYLDPSVRRWYPVIILNKGYDLEKYGIGNKYTQIQDFKELIRKTGETTYRSGHPTKVSQPTFHTYEYITTEFKQRDQVPLLKCEIPQNTNWFRRGSGGFDDEKKTDDGGEELDESLVSQPLRFQAEDIQVVVLINCNLRDHFERKNSSVLCVIKQDRVQYFEWLNEKLVEVNR